MKLDEGQLRDFKRLGYHRAPGLLDPELAHLAVEWFWRQSPPDLKRGEPDTWPGSFHPAGGSNQGTEFREGPIWRTQAARREEWMLRLLSAHPPVREIAEQLLGRGSLEPPSGAALHCTRPEGQAPRRQCHVDKHPHQLRVIGYLCDVGERSGATAVWPGSHLRFFGHFRSRYLFTPDAGYEKLVLEIDARGPLDCAGRAGDVLFCHHRLGHMAGPNASSRLRLAVLGNLNRRDLRERAFEPPTADPWRDWSEELRGVAWE